MLKVKQYADRGVAGEQRNASKIMQKFGVDFQDEILQVARDKVYDNYASKNWTFKSNVNEIMVVPIGEGCRSEQYFARLADYTGQEFSTVGATCVRTIDGKRCVSCSFMGLLSRALDSAFCSISILSTLRLLYGKDREMKRGYIMGLRSSGFGKHDKNKEMLALATRSCHWFGVQKGAPRARIPQGLSFKNGFEQGLKDGGNDKFGRGPKKLAA